MAPLRFGLVGTGHWALHTHGTALMSSPDAELVGVWGRDSTKADDVGRRLGARGYPDFDELLRDVDAVAMAVPPHVQAPLAMRAAQAGRHLLLEKPLALSLSEAQAVTGAVESAGVACVVFLTNRFRPDAEAWLADVAGAGPIYSAHLVQYGNIFQPGSPYAGSQWRRQHGALWDIGPHALATVLPLLGAVRSVTARRGPQGSDTVHLLLSHEPRTGAPDDAAEGGTGSPVTSGTGELGPVSTISLSLTMPPASLASHFVAYTAQGPRVRPESRSEPVGAFGRAITELRQMVESGSREHRCDARSSLEMVRILTEAQRATEPR